MRCSTIATSFPSIAFPARLVKIGDNALYWGEAIAGRSNHNISVVTFAPDCRLNEIGKSAFKNCKIKEIELPASVTTLGQKPFEGCSIARLVVPDSLASDGFTDLVAGISGLKNIECRSTCKNFTTVDGVLFLERRNGAGFLPRRQGRGGLHRACRRAEDKRLQLQGQRRRQSRGI